MFAEQIVQKCYIFKDYSSKRMLNKNKTYDNLETKKKQGNVKTLKQEKTVNQLLKQKAINIDVGYF